MNIMDDKLIMERAIELALKGKGRTGLNPMVGAVIVDAGGTIIGQGYHQCYGSHHAEVNAIASVEDQSLLPGSTIYVTLEPCSHYGKTPPCVDLIIEKGIKKVVVATIDPNPSVSGAGVAKLREAGVEVVLGVAESECRAINRPFFIRHEQRRPYVILKWAQSADGFLDIVRPDGMSAAWMTGDDARRVVHQWRAECDAIMVGRKTVEMDDPQLTVRDAQGENPLRVVLDRRMKLPVSSRVFDCQASTLIFTEIESKVAHSASQTIDYSQDILPQVLAHLNERSVGVLLVEGGAQLLNSFIEAGLWDEARIFTAQKPILDYYPYHFSSRVMGIKAPEIEGLEVETDETLRLKILFPR